MKDWFIKRVKTFKDLPIPSESEIVYFVEDLNKYYAEYDGTYIETEEPEINE